MAHKPRPTVPLMVRIDPAIWDAVQAYVDSTGTTKTAVVEQALQAFLAAQVRQED